MRRSVQSHGMLVALAIIEIDAALAQGRLANAEALIDRLEGLSKKDALFYRARLALMNRQPLESLGLITQHLEMGGRGFSAISLLLSVLRELEDSDRGWSVLSKVASSYQAVEVNSAIAAWLMTPEQYPKVRQAIARSKKEGVGSILDAVAEIEAARRCKSLAETRELAVGLAARLIRDGSSSQILTGWQCEGGLPMWALPFERIPVDQALLTENRWQDALAQCLRRIHETELELFLSRTTLKHWMSGAAQVTMADAIEFGVVSEAPATTILNEVAAALHLERPLGDRGAGPAILRHLNGIQISIVIYRDRADGGLAVEEDGIVSHFSPISVKWIERFGQRAPVPANLPHYLDEAFDVTRSVDLTIPASLSAASHQVVDADSAVIRLCRDLLIARAAHDVARCTTLARALKRVGEHEVELVLMGLEKSYLPESLPDLMSQTRFLVHLGDGVEAEFHIDLWYSFVKAADPNALLVVRSRPLFNLLREQRPDLDAIYIKSGIEAEWLVSGCPKLAGVLYISNTGNTVHFLRFNHVKHVWLGHGDSEKAASCHKFFRAYDEVWCAGMAQIDRFRNSGMAHDSIRFRIVGRPTLRPLFEAADRPAGDSFLYLPTWEGFQAEQEYTSVRDAMRFVPAIVDMTGRSALIKFHPWTGNRVPALKDIESQLSAMHVAAKGAVQVIPRSQPAADLMPGTGFLVADVSSVVTDYLFTGRPIFLFMPDRADLRMTTSGMPMESYCYVFRDEVELKALVEKVIIEGSDYLRVDRLRARDYFVDCGRSTSGAFEEELRALVVEHDNPAHAWSNARTTVPATETFDRPRIVGHRGVKSQHAENSLSGFNAAARMAGLDAVEFDVHLTADGEVVVLHDPTLDRTTTGRGAVAAHTLAEIRKMRLLDPASAAKKALDETVPTLDEALDVLGATELDLFIELKNDALGDAYPQLVEKVLRIIRLRNLTHRSTLTSFSPAVLEDVRRLDPTIPLLASVNYRSIEMLGGVERSLATLNAIPQCSISLHHELFTQLQERGPRTLDMRRFGVWVVNTKNQLRMLHDEGVRQIFTDKPELAIELQRELKARGLNGRDMAGRETVDASQILVLT